MSKASNKRNPEYDRARIELHIKRINEKELPVVFCVRCGSTLIDQNFIDELRCYDCNNTTKWDGRKFSINRYLVSGDTDAERMHDSASSFELFPAGPPPDQEES